MPWLRSGDNAATHPALLEVKAYAPDEPWALNEMRGFIWALASYSAEHLTDSVISLGAVIQAGEERWQILVQRAIWIGLLEETEQLGRPAYRLIDDPDFMHIRTRAEIEFERARRNDTQDAELRWAAVLRDGDLCRWCGTPVHWKGANGKYARKGVLDHLYPERVGTDHVTTVDEVVVACTGCNSARGAGPDSFREKYPAPRPVPRRRLYSRHSRLELAKRGIQVPEVVDDNDKIPGAATAAASSAAAPGAPADQVVGKRTAPAAGGLSAECSGIDAAPVPNGLQSASSREGGVEHRPALGTSIEPPRSATGSPVSVPVMSSTTQGLDPVPVGSERLVYIEPSRPADVAGSVPPIYTSRPPAPPPPSVPSHTPPPAPGPLASSSPGTKGQDKDKAVSTRALRSSNARVGPVLEGNPTVDKPNGTRSSRSSSGKRRGRRRNGR